MSTGPTWASAFPGDGTYLMTPGEVANMPASSPYGFIALVYQNMIPSAFLPNVTSFIPIQNVADNYFDNTVYLSTTPWGPQLNDTGTQDSRGRELYSNQTPGFMLGLTISSDPNYDNYTSFTTWYPTTPVPNGFMLPDEGNHHLLLMGWDSASETALASIDGQPFTLNINQSTGGFAAVNYGYPWAVGGPLGYGYTSNYAATHGYLGLMAPSYFIDPTDSNLIAHFWDSNNNVPLLPDQSGSALLVDYGVQFQIWLQGAPPSFRRNLTNNQTQNGITSSDTNNEFEIVGGEGLEQAANSPWG